MRHPAAVELGEFDESDYRLPVDAPLAKGSEVGRQLAACCCLTRFGACSAKAFGSSRPKKGLGLRLRVCLHDDLIDLP